MKLVANSNVMTDEIVVGKEHSLYKFDASDAPVCRVDPGTIVTFEISDEPYLRQMKGEIDFGNKRNPVTGPVAINGAKLGDALRIDIISIEITRAWAVWLPGYGSLGNKISFPKIKSIPIEQDQLILSPRISLPVDAMIGCIGVAPKRGIGSTTYPAGKWGGNMDLRELRAGVTLYLPVFIDNALLSVGDLHAAMGTGEPCCMAIEAGGNVTLRLDLVKSMNLPYPRIRTKEQIICIGMGNKMEQAQINAIDQAYNLLITEFGLEPFEAYAYASGHLQLRFGGPASPIALAVFDHPINIL